jgi:uncharacterized RDD family membrane protein YckC
MSFYNLLVLKNLPLQIFLFLIQAAYKPLMEYYYGATLGKMLVKIKVVDLHYEPLSLNQAFVRYVPWLLSIFASVFSVVMIFLDPAFLNATELEQLGALQEKGSIQFLERTLSVFQIVSCLMVVSNDLKQGLHDKLAKTYCIYDK